MRLDAGRDGWDKRAGGACPCNRGEGIDRDELIELLKIVNSSADDNRKKAELANKIGKISGAIINVGKRFAAGL